jgi:FlaA1/EpsC-like NDP-sugar epimerase
LLVAVFYNLTFQLVFLGNIVLVDEGEKAAVFPYSYSIIVVVLWILFYFYIKHLQGSRRYRKVKEIIWGLFFAATAVSSLFWFSVNAAIFSQELLPNLILLTIIFLVSTLLAVQLVFKFKKEGSGKD